MPGVEQAAAGRRAVRIRLPQPDRRGVAAVLRCLSLLLLIAVWQAAAVAAQSRVLPPPAVVLETLLRATASGELPYHLGVTLARVAVSFLLAMAAGTALGILMGRRRWVDALLDTWLIVALNVPALVTIILCYVWFGLIEAAAVLAVALNKFPTVTVVVREGARAVDRELMQVADVFRLGRGRRFFLVYLPQLQPHLLAAARAGLALVWKIVLVVELLGRSDGIGFQLGMFFQLFDIAGILAYTLAFTLVILAIEMIALRPLERRLARWRP